MWSGGKGARGERKVKRVTRMGGEKRDKEEKEEEPYVGRRRGIRRGSRRRRIFNIRPHAHTGKR